MPGGATLRPLGDRVVAGVGSSLNLGRGHHSIFVSGSILPAGFRFLRSLWNRVWLQYRQMTRTFSFTSCPPKLCSKMWSTSALLGCRLYS